MQTHRIDLEARNVKRVLIVDDNQDGADSLAAVVRITFGHKTHIAYDGETGVQAAAEFQPDIILLDIGMPVMSGYTAAKLLRRWYRGPLVAISGWCAPYDVQAALEAGFDEHLAKPVGLETLTRILR